MKLSKIFYAITVVCGICAVYLQYKSSRDEIRNEYAMIVYDKKVNVCSNLAIETVKNITQIAIFIENDSTALIDSIISPQGRFNTIAFSGYPFLSDSLITSIEYFNTTIVEIRDSVEFWKSNYAIGPNSLPYLYNKSPLNKKFSDSVTKLYTSIRKETYREELN